MLYMNKKSDDNAALTVKLSPVYKALLRERLNKNPIVQTIQIMLAEWGAGALHMPADSSLFFKINIWKFIASNVKTFVHLIMTTKRQLVKSAKWELKQPTSQQVVLENI